MAEVRRQPHSKPRSHLPRHRAFLLFGYGLACLRAPRQATAINRFPLARNFFSSFLPFFVGWCHQAQSSTRVPISSGPIYLPALLHCRVEACFIAAASRDRFVASTSLSLLDCSELDTVLYRSIYLLTMGPSKPSVFAGDPVTDLDRNIPLKSASAPERSRKGDTSMPSGEGPVTATDQLTA